MIATPHLAASAPLSLSVISAIGGMLNVHIGLGVILIAVALYYRKAISAFATVHKLSSRLVFSAVVLGVLLVTEIVPGVNTERAVEIVTWIVSQVVSLLPSNIAGALPL